MKEYIEPTIKIYEFDTDVRAEESTAGNGLINGGAGGSGSNDNIMEWG